MPTSSFSLQQVREYVMATTSEQTAAQMNAANAVRPALSNTYLNGQPTKTLQLQEAMVGTKYGPGGFVYFGIEDEREPGIPKPQDVSSSTQSSFWNERDQKNVFGEIFLLNSQMSHLLLDKELWIQLLNQVTPHPLFVVYQQRYEWSGAFTAHNTYMRSSTAFHIIAKVPSQGQLEAAFYLRLHVKTKKWHLILIGNQVKDHTNDIGSYLSSLNGRRSNPFAIIVLLLLRFTQRLEQEYSSMEQHGSSQERRTGLGSLGLNSVPISPTSRDIQVASFIAGNLRAAAFGIDFQNELVAFIQDCRRKMSYQIAPHFVEEERGIDEDLESLKRVLMRQKAHYQQNGLPRTQAQIDGMAMLISQGDAKSSIDLAHSSTQIATSTAQETTTMMTIAALGLLYLPATLMSSIFNTVFFNLDPVTNELRITKDFWIFVIAALLLTILTLSLWIWLKWRGMSDISYISQKLHVYRKRFKSLGQESHEMQSLQAG